MSKCPDCREELELITIVHNKALEEIMGDDVYYRCPKCKNEYDVGDIDE